MKLKQETNNVRNNHSNTNNHPIPNYLGMQKRIDTLRDSYTEFLTQYTVYVKAVGDHSEAVQGALEDLDNKAEKGYYATTALAAHVEYLDKRINELEEKCHALQR